MSQVVPERGTTPAALKASPTSRVERALGRERRPRGGAGWISGAIYGANDGLAAVFGIIAGVSAATGGSSFVLTAGLSGALASDGRRQIPDLSPMAAGLQWPELAVAKTELGGAILVARALHVVTGRPTHSRTALMTSRALAMLIFAATLAIFWLGVQLAS
jgi:hypothetical protein